MSETAKTCKMGTAKVRIILEPARYIAELSSGNGTKYASRYFATSEEAEAWAEKQARASGCYDEPKKPAKKVAKKVTEPES